MAAKVYYSPFIPAFSSSGAPIPGARLYFYESGTNILAPIYPDSSLTQPLDNPVVADAAARFPDIFLDESITYRVKMTDRKGVPLGADIDPYIPGQALAGPAGKDAARSQRYDAIAVEGQVRIPEVGNLIDTQSKVPFTTDHSYSELYLNGEFVNGLDYAYYQDGPYATVPIPIPEGTKISLLGSPIRSEASGSGFNAADSVQLHLYPGSPILNDNDNAKWAAARADVTNPLSANFGKRIFAAPGKGSGTPLLDEPVIKPDGITPIDSKFLARVGDWLIDAWSNNGIVPDNYPDSPITDFDNVGSNIGSGIHLYGIRGLTRFRRPHRLVQRPYIFVVDPIASNDTTTNGVDEQRDVAVDFSIRDIVVIGTQHWRDARYGGWREHVNEISINGGTNFYIDVQGYASCSDVVYLGSGNIGGSTHSRHNKNGTVIIEADGYEANQRNALSIIDGENIYFEVTVRNYTRPGGVAAFDQFDPFTGIGGPGGVDVEPNFFDTNPIVKNIRGKVYAENNGGAALATLLLFNDTLPNPIQNIDVEVEAVRCRHGKHICIGGNGMKTPYNIRVRGNATDCLRSFEVDAGQGIVHEGGKNLRSERASFIGYFGGQHAEDYWRINEIDQEQGVTGDIDDTASIQVRGWRRGGRRNCQMINGAVRGYHYIANFPIEGLVSENCSFENRPEITNGSMGFADYVDTSAGGADIRPATIIETGKNSNGIPDYNWSVVGAKINTVPIFGAYLANQKLKGLDSFEPGAPDAWRSVASNVVGNRPQFVSDSQRSGFLVDPPSNTSGFSWGLTNMVKDANNRLTAVTPANYPTSSPGFMSRATVGPVTSTSMVGRGVYSGAGTVYFGVATIPNPTSVADIKAGWWLADLGAIARPLYNGSASSLFVPNHKYNYQYRLAGVIGADNTFIYQYSTDEGQNWQNLTLVGAAVPTSGLLYPVVLIGAGSETIQILKVN